MNELTFDPPVNTLTAPAPKILLAARRAVQLDPVAQQILLQSRQEGWGQEETVDRLSRALLSLLESDPRQIEDAARYLVEENAQLGDGILIVSAETGKAIAKVSEEDIWQPPPIPREDGTSITPPPRLKPEIEGAITVWAFNQGREAEIESALVQRLPQTELLRQEGDRRLRLITRRGRKQIVEDLREALPQALPGSTSGIVREFLSHFEFRGEPPQGLQPLPLCTSWGNVSVPLQDLKSFNRCWDVFTFGRSVIANQWGKQIAKSVSEAAHKVIPPVLCNKEDLPSDLFWIAGPELYVTFGRKGRRMLPVEALPTGLKRGIVGAVTVGAFEFQYRDVIADRLEISARIECQVWVDFSQIRTFRLLNESPEVVTGEVLRR